MIFSKLIGGRSREEQARRDELVAAYRIGQVSGRIDFEMGLPAPRVNARRDEEPEDRAIRLGRLAGWDEALRAEAVQGVAVFERLLAEVSP